MSRIITASVFFLMALGIAFFYVLPEWQRFQGLGVEIVQLEDASKEFDELIANRDSILNLINGITKDDLARVDQVLPRGARASDFLVAFEALTASNGMALRRIDLVSSQKGKATAATGNPLASQPRPTSASAGAMQTGQEGLNESLSIEGTLELPFGVQVAGTYDNFKKFLAALEKNIRLIDVDQVSFSASGKDESLEFTLKAKTYYQ